MKDFTKKLTEALTTQLIDQKKRQAEAEKINKAHEFANNEAVSHWEDYAMHLLNMIESQLMDDPSVLGKQFEGRDSTIVIDLDKLVETDWQNCDSEMLQSYLTDYQHEMTGYAENHEYAMDILKDRIKHVNVLDNVQNDIVKELEHLISVDDAFWTTFNNNDKAISQTISTTSSTGQITAVISNVDHYHHMLYLNWRVLTIKANNCANETLKNN